MISIYPTLIIFVLIKIKIKKLNGYRTSNGCKFWSRNDRTFAEIERYIDADFRYVLEEAKSKLTFLDFCVL